MAFVLLYGGPLATVFMPVAAGASILSSLLGPNVYAGGIPTVFSVDNSQTIALLSADVSHGGKKEKQSEAAGNLNGTIVDDSALLAAVTPSSGNATGGTGVDFSETSPDDISVYVVRRGDSITQIAEMFEVSVNTILWGNDLKKGEKLKEGDTLFILPVSGVQHTVAKGETLASIAKKYKVDMEIITGFNGLEKGAVLAVGDALVIPDAEMPNDAAKPSSGKPGSGSSGSSKWADAKGYFIHPVPQMKRRSQGPHGPGGRGIDMAAPTGTPIVAAASGTVILSRGGYSGGYGEMIIVQHSNGTKTLYAHMSKRVATTGAKVSQGETIGYVGSTGRSTGPHLHFEVQGAKNPF
ncbi:MAG: M23 family metallopeptidase [bacterium]|nr:M23 family metallopeptidase [bacterium]